VFNGGNVRPGPGTSFNPPLDQINAGETVQLLGKTANGEWFQIINERSVTGWVSVTLLSMTDEIAAKVPVVDENGTAAQPTSTTPAPATGLTARVFNGGNVRPGPGTSFKPPLDQINAGETVQLLAKTSNGQWFQIATPRNVTGWVSVTLLTIDPATADKVPVSQ
jgi:flagellar FliL protein